MDMGSCREGGRGTGIVQGKGLEVAVAALWCVGKKHTRGWGWAKRSGVRGLGRHRGELETVRQSEELEMERVEGLKRYDLVVVALVG